MSCVCCLFIYFLLYIYIGIPTLLLSWICFWECYKTFNPFKSIIDFFFDIEHSCMYLIFPLIFYSLFCFESLGISISPINVIMKHVILWNGYIDKHCVGVSEQAYYFLTGFFIRFIKNTEIFFFCICCFKWISLTKTNWHVNVFVNQEYSYYHNQIKTRNNWCWSNTKDSF